MFLRFMIYLVCFILQWYIKILKMQSAEDYTPFAMQLMAPQAKKKAKPIWIKESWCIKKQQTIDTYQRSTDAKPGMDHKDASAVAYLTDCYRDKNNIPLKEEPVRLLELYLSLSLSSFTKKYEWSFMKLKMLLKPVRNIHSSSWLHFESSFE